MMINFKNITSYVDNQKVHFAEKSFESTQVLSQEDKNNVLEIEGKELILVDGIVDILADFATPGHEYREDQYSGAQAAIYGGVTEVILNTDTTPKIDSPQVLESISNWNTVINIHSAALLFKKSGDKTILNDLHELNQYHAAYFSTGFQNHPMDDVILRAMEYCQHVGKTVFIYLNHPTLFKDGQINEGIQSTKLGLKGLPKLTEIIQLKSYLSIAEYCSNPIHLFGITCVESINLIKEAKITGLNISCSTTAHHLMFNEQDVESFNVNLKLQPPLRTEIDRLALCEAVLDGTIDIVCSNHQPYAFDDKHIDFADAKAVGVGVLDRLEDLGSHDLRNSNSRRLDRADFEAGIGQDLSDLRGFFVRAEIIAQPGEGDLHVRSGRDSGKETKVVLGEHPDVGDTGEIHGQTIETESKSEAVHLLGIVGIVTTLFVNFLKDRRIDHAASGQFHPLASESLGAEIDLVAWFGKGEEVRAKTDLGIGAEKFEEEKLDRSLEVGKADSRSDIESLHLRELRQMGGINLITAVGGTWGDDPNRGRVRHHRSDLDRGSMGTKKSAVGEIKCILLVAGWVIGRRVQGIKAVPLGLDIGAIGDCKPEPAEDLNRAIHQQGKRVE
jgi:dihydroorotase-like cyclic amidohydrolase